MLQKEFKKKKHFCISSIRSDHVTEFENEFLKKICNENGISHTFSSPRTPQQNGVVERKNRTLVEMARTMLHEYSLPLYFWAEVVNTSCYISNRVFKRPILKKMSYELWNNRKSKISYLRVFGCKYFILNTKDNLRKLTPKPMKEFF